MLDVTEPEIPALIQRFPRLFHGRAPQCWSAIPPGWLALVSDLCAAIDGMLDDAQAERFEVVQIKEKLARLRFYFRLSADGAAPPSLELIRKEQVRMLVDDAAGRSTRTCFICGGAGLLGQNDFRVLCAVHRRSAQA